MFKIEITSNRVNILQKNTNMTCETNNTPFRFYFVTLQQRVVYYIFKYDKKVFSELSFQPNGVLTFIMFCY